MFKDLSISNNLSIDFNNYQNINNLFNIEKYKKEGFFLFQFS
jgi:hypothetical protein